MNQHSQPLYLFTKDITVSALEVYLYTTMRYINWHFTFTYYYRCSYVTACSYWIYCWFKWLIQYNVTNLYVNL